MMFLSIFLLTFYHCITIDIVIKGDAIMQKTIRDVTFNLLRNLDMTTIFGNPGSTEETFLENLPDDFTYIHALQEASAVGAADGYAQLSGKVGLVSIHTTPGLCNSMSNIFSAYMNKTPMIIVAGNQTREMLLSEPWLSNPDPEVVPRPFVKWSYQPVRAEDVPGAFMRAYSMALQPPCGPVFLSIPLDDWDKPAAEDDFMLKSVCRRVAADPERISDFARMINSAKNPVLIYGADIARSEGWDIAQKVAEKLQAPVWAAPASELAPFDESHPLYCGGLPFAIEPLANKLVGHDLVLIVGAPVFRYFPYAPGEYFPEGMKILHISDNPEEIARAVGGNSLISDAKLALDSLYELLDQRAQRVKPVFKQEHGLASSPLKKVKEVNLSALTLFKTLREACPKDTILVEESPSNIAALHTAWKITSPRSFFTFASGSLGWGLPASIGLALAERESSEATRPIVSIIGDGSLQYSIQGLWSAVQEKLPILYVVVDNEEYGILKAFAKYQHNPNVPALNLPGIDIELIAKGYGCDAYTTSDPQKIKEIAASAFSKDKPTVLVVKIDKSVPPLI